MQAALQRLSCANNPSPAESRSMWPFNKPADNQLTLKQRVTEFWKWFALNSQRFYATIEDKKCSELVDDVSAAIDRWLPDLAWVFGPGENKIGHSFTLSGEGILAKQFVTAYWLSQAPKITGWTFYSFRQQEETVRDFSLELDEHESFRPAEFWLFPYVNVQNERIDITVWHPSIHRLPDQPRFTALFLVLDELLGEFGTQNWIGEIKFSDAQLQKSVPILELREVIAETQAEYGWKKCPPTESHSTYRMPNQHEWLRGDTVVGGTRFYSLISEYLDAEGPCDHPLPGLGIDYAFVTIEAAHFPKGGEVAARGTIEDAVTDALESQAAGISIGGATGSNNCYLDFALYDGERSIQIVKQILRKHRVPKSTKIRFFTSDRAKDVISI